MHGTNPLRPPRSPDDGGALEVKSIFSTLQGEGPHAGVPAVFVRLAGCNLACDFCDTEFEDGENIPLEGIVRQVDSLSRHGGAWVRRLAVITGGEPLRQNIAPLCEALLKRGFTVQIETNGTLMRPLPEGVQVVCSPKNTGGGYMPLREDVLHRAVALKFLVSYTRKGYTEVPDVGQSRHGALPVYVQPMDEGNAQKNLANREYAVKLAAEKGYRLSLQWHKIVGIE